jgi:hypothetical protein
MSAWSARSAVSRASGVAAERRVGQERVDAIVEAVRAHELVVEVDRDREAVLDRHAGRLVEDRVVGGLPAEGPQRRLDDVEQGLAPGRRGGDRGDVGDLVDRQIDRRQHDRLGGVGRPPRLGLGLGRGLDGPGVGGHGQLGELALERAQGGVGLGAAQPHVGRAAVARQHVDVRQRGLERLGDDALHDRDVVGRRVEHHEVLVRQVLGLEGGGGGEVDAAVGDPERQRLEVDAGVELVGGDDRHRGGVEAGGDRGLGLRRRMERQGRSEVGRVLHRQEQLGDHLGRRGVVGRQLEHPAVGLLVVGDRGQEEPTIGREVLAGVERGQGPDRRQAVARQVGRDVLVVDLEAHRVHEVQGIAAGLVEDDLDRLRARQGGVEGLRGQGRVVGLTGDRRQGVGGLAGDLAGALGDLERVGAGVDGDAGIVAATRGQRHDHERAQGAQRAHHGTNAKQ